MFAVIFLVEPHPDRWDEYLAHAADLRPELERIDGFLDNRRYRCRRQPGRVLSLSLWCDEKAVIRWRTHAGHHAVQHQGRQAVFRDYHLRVGEVTHEDGRALPRTRMDTTETGQARMLSLIENPVGPVPAVPADGTFFDGITIAGSSLLLLPWRISAGPPGTILAGDRRLDVAILRDYGLHDRREAPQYHPPPGSGSG